MEILSKYWPYGSCSILCKTIAMLQALCIFVSTISITAIAFDRYQVSSLFTIFRADISMQMGPIEWAKSCPDINEVNGFNL